jgi:hypothetical protein
MGVRFNPNRQRGYMPSFVIAEKCDGCKGGDKTACMCTNTDLKGKALESGLLSTQEADGYVVPRPKTDG